MKSLKTKVVETDITLRALSSTGSSTFPTSKPFVFFDHLRPVIQTIVGTSPGIELLRLVEAGGAFRGVP
jgi:hypothetical protein